MLTKVWVILFALGCGTGTCFCQAAELTVFSNGHANVWLDSTCEGYKSTGMAGPLADFARCFKKMTGTELPTTKTDDRIPIRLTLLTPPTGEELLDARAAQGWRVVVAPNQIVLSARTRLGLQNALYSLLDRWGCRWIMIGELGEVIPRRAVLTLPLGAIESPKSSFVALEARGGSAQYVTDWWNRNQSGYEHWMTGQHYWLYALPPEQHFKTHPEWYALIGGKRVPTQLCTSNPEVIAKMIEAAKEFLRRRPTVLSFPMDPFDNLDFCQCPRCKAMDPPGTDSFGQPLVTDRVVRFANEVARAIAPEFPGRVVAFYAYNNHTEPPVSVKPEKNVAIIITRGNYCWVHYLPDEKCPTTLEFLEMVRRWGKLTPNLYLYDYDPISWTGCLPCPVYLERAKELAMLYREYGIKGGVTDYSPYFNRAYPTLYVNTYMERRIKADPSRDPDVILTDMCESFFGPAAKSMERYYRELAGVTRYRHPGREMVSAGLYRYYEMFNSKMIRAARSALNESAKLCVHQPPYDERIRRVDMGQRYLEAYLEGIKWAKAGDYTRTVAAFDRVDRVITELDAVKGIDAQDARTRLNTARLKTLAEHFPDKLGLVRRWKLKGPFDNSGKDADMKIDEPSQVSNIDSWTDYTSPEGLLNLVNVLKNKQTPWKLSYMYAGTKIRVDKPTPVQLCMDSFCPFRVYLNGKSVYHRPGLDADSPDKRIVPVTLQAGENVIVVKLSQTIRISHAFPWGLYFRIAEKP